MEIVDRAHIRLRVFERGVGETLACGTGACAAVAVGRRHGRLDATVEVELPGGKLEITWNASRRTYLDERPDRCIFHRPSRVLGEYNKA